MVASSTGVTPPLSRRAPNAETLFALIPVALVTLWALTTGFRGADYPGQVFRAEFWRHAPTATWDFRWYGGHSTLTYSVLAPPLAALVTPFGLTLIATVAAVALACGLGRHFATRQGRIASGVALGIASSMNLIVGRTSFALGLAVAVGALWLWDRGYPRWSVVAAPVVGLASPVAAVLLGAVIVSALAADWIPGRAARTTAVESESRALTHPARLFAYGCVVAVPLVVLALSSARGPQAAGEFPYRVRDLIGTTALLGLLAAASSGQTVADRLVRAGAVVGLAANTVLAAVPNPLGANFVRYTSMVAVPVGVGYLVDRWRGSAQGRQHPGLREGAAVLFAVLTLVAWTQFGWREVNNFRAWRADPSHDADFFQPLLAAIAEQPDPVGRVEIPFTRLHMETSVVASHVALARGWERQLDRARNDELYSTELTPEAYRAWLVRNGVGYLAVPINPDVGIDFGGEAEMDVIAQIVDTQPAVEWLDLVWSNDDWTLYRVEAANRDRPWLTIGWDAIEFDTETAGAIQVSAAFDPRLGIIPAGCLRPDEYGQIIAEVPSPGGYRIVERRWGLFTTATRCDG